MRSEADALRAAAQAQTAVSGSDGRSGSGGSAGDGDGDGGLIIGGARVRIEVTPVAAPAAVNVSTPNAATNTYNNTITTSASTADERRRTVEILGLPAHVSWSALTRICV